MQRHLTLSVTLVSGLLIAGCASTSKTYPSLAIRDAERVTGSFETEGSAPVTAPAPLSSKIVERLGQLQAMALSSHQDFISATPAARNAVSEAAGTAVTTDRWATAQIALSDLDSLRSQTAATLSDLDLIFADATLAFKQREAIAATRKTVIKYIREEDRVLSDLRATFGR